MKQKLIFIILNYFKFFAKLQLLKTRPLIIGVTGSAGKTSTRNAIYAILKDKYRVKVSYKANSETGIPLNILGLTPKTFNPLEWFKLILLAPVKLLTNWESYDVYLVEMGIDSPKPPKNMGYLLTILKPNIAIILNAAPMHSEPFDYLVKTKDLKARRQAIIKLIANEKGKIVTTMNQKQTAIVNIDQRELKALTKNIKAQVISFGESNQAEIKITGYQVTKTGTSFSFKIADKNLKIQLKNQLLAEHFKYSLAASIAVATKLHFTLSTIKQQLEKNFRLPPGRSSLIQGINDSLIIDSSYNASAKPMIDMLDLLDKLEANNKYALLGDMRELGEVSKLEHQKVVKKATKVCDRLYLVGPQMKKYALAIAQETTTPIKWFKNANLAAQEIKKVLKKDDILLVKGSQNTLLLEIAVEKLMANPETANQLLARRGRFWDQKRNNLIK